MRQRLHVRSMDCHHRVEQEREVDALRFTRAVLSKFPSVGFSTPAFAIPGEPVPGVRLGLVPPGRILSGSREGSHLLEVGRSTRGGLEQKRGGISPPYSFQNL